MEMEQSPKILKSVARIPLDSCRFPEFHEILALKVSFVDNSFKSYSVKENGSDESIYLNYLL